MRQLSQPAIRPGRRAELGAAAARYVGAVSIMIAGAIHLQ